MGRFTPPLAGHSLFTDMTDDSSTRNLKLILQYDGTDYHGSQLQVGVRTVQGVLEEALEKVLGVKTRIHASGRTDTGVHALGQVVHFFTGSDITPEQLIGKLNEFLPPDVRVLSAEEVPFTFHSRYGAASKVYRYTILNARIDGRYRAMRAYVFPAKLDVDRMRKAAEYLVGTHDFSAFGVNPGWEVKTPVKTIRRLDVKQQGNYIFIEVEADGFLYKMVRSIVGTLVKVGVGKTEPEEMVAVLESRDRCRAGATAPPQGLCLVEVKYPPDKT